MTSRNISNAIEIVSSFSNIRYPVCPSEICEELGIKLITDKPLGKDGYLICQHGKKVILVNSNINNRHRRNFVISHELGHFLLHRDQLYSCDYVSEASNQNINTPTQEKEANDFATELLIPRSELIKQIPNGYLEFSNIFSIAEVFDVSVTHAAIQSIMLSNSESEVLLCYEKHRLKWYKTANRYTYPRMIPKYCPVHLPSAPKRANVTGVWTDLYQGSAHQEIFCPYGEQYLVLLSGQRQ